MTVADKLRELLATRPQMPNTEELFRWWQTSGELLDELLNPTRPATPLDEVTDNLVADLHELEHEGVAAGVVARLIRMTHALALVHQDTRSRVRALERGTAVRRG